MRRLVKSPAATALLAALLGRYLAFALRTTRWRVQGAANVAPHIMGEPVIVAFWHERLPLFPALMTYARAHGTATRTYVLVSRHRDGRVIGEIIRRFSFDVLHGSTLRNKQDKGGAAGLRAMLAVLAEGHHVGITPDGPRGPRRVAAPGVAHVAARAGVKVMPCSAQCSHRRVLRSWDRMVVPLPFGRGVIVCGETIAVPRDGADAALPLIARAMTEAADRADAIIADRAAWRDAA